MIKGLFLLLLPYLIALSVALILFLSLRSVLRNRRRSYTIRIREGRKLHKVRFKTEEGESFEAAFNRALATWKGQTGRN
jgi:hypothetical protein